MGLPTKKQLQKHRRGTRKALDTLDALNDSNTPTASDVDNIQDKKAVKNEASPSQKMTKTPSAKTGKTKKPTKKASAPKTAVKKVAGDKPVTDAKTESPVSTVKKINVDKPEIELGGSDENVETGAKPQMAVQKNRIDEKEAVLNKEIEISHQMDSLEEDTQKDRFLSFRIGNEDYGIEIRFVTEIIVMHVITEVPDTPVFIKGVINLRGKVIPVMDVRERFKLEKREYDDRTCIIVVDVDEISVGLIVDTVNEVIDIPENSIDPPPATHSGSECNYIQGLGKVGEKVKILLDVENVLSTTA